MFNRKALAAAKAEIAILHAWGTGVLLQAQADAGKAAQYKALGDRENNSAAYAKIQAEYRQFVIQSTKGTEHDGAVICRLTQERDKALRICEINRTLWLLAEKIARVTES
jgi:hypothetical protein